MEAENYYQKNLETGKLNIYTTKPFYDSLAEEQKKIFKQFCLWSNKQQCWVSKGKAENCIYLKNRLKDLGFQDAGTTGERLGFEEQVRTEQEKAADRAGRAEARSEKAEKTADTLYNKAKEMASAIPFGQPILIGHHSEKRDRNYRDKIHNTYGRAFGEMDKADYYRDKAETALFTAEGTKYHNPKYLQNRIKECNKNLRALNLRLEGKFFKDSPPKEISLEARDFYNKRIGEEQEKLQFFEQKMKTVNPDWTAPGY